MKDKLQFAAFDIWSDYGHFRRGYTNTSPLSYPFPSRTTIAGLVSAVLGLGRDKYYDLFQECNSAIALQILNPIKRVTVNQNLIDTKHGYTLWDIQIKEQAPRTQIPFEYIKEPKYRIFVWLENEEKMKKLCSMISQRKTIYTLYMGITEHIANYKPFMGGCVEGILKKTYREEIEIHSIIPIEKANIILDTSKTDRIYGYVKVPGFMNSSRIVTKYIEFYYEERGKSLKINKGEYYSIGGELNIVPF